MTCSTCSGGWHAMPERRARVAAVLGLVAALVILAAVPATAFAASGRERPVESIAIADVPPQGGEDCVDDPDAQPGVGLRECPKGFDIAALLPFVAGGVVVLLGIGVGWFLVMRRRASRPFLADDAVGATGTGTGSGASTGTGTGVPAGARPAVAAGWWTCKNCGSSNMTDSARCYRCGSWPR
jgi:hypothetical protein